MKFGSQTIRLRSPFVVVVVVVLVIDLV